MELNKYQEQAMTTCLPTSNNFAYMLLNLIGEVGEFCEKSLQVDMPEDMKPIIEAMQALGYGAGMLAKQVRKTENHPLQSYKPEFTDEQKAELRKEAGDIEWQLSGLEKVMGWTKEDTCWENLEKLQGRKKAGTIDGNGDGITDRTK